ncbi:hypothetical protein SALBM311S_03486 [Streptomyces alboniger]
MRTTSVANSAVATAVAGPRRLSAARASRSGTASPSAKVPARAPRRIEPIRRAAGPVAGAAGTTLQPRTSTHRKGHGHGRRPSSRTGRRPYRFRQALSGTRRSAGSARSRGPRVDDPRPDGRVRSRTRRAMALTGCVRTAVTPPEGTYPPAGLHLADHQPVAPRRESPLSGHTPAMTGPAGHHRGVVVRLRRVVVARRCAQHHLRRVMVETPPRAGPSPPHGPARFFCPERAPVGSGRTELPHAVRTPQGAPTARTGTLRLAGTASARRG